MSLRRLLILLVLLATLLSACAPRLEASQTNSPGSRNAFSPEAELPAMEGGAFLSNQTGLSQVDRLVIKNANLGIAVDDPARAMDSIADLSERLGGFVVSSSLYKTTTGSGVEVPVANITIRVPAQRLNEAMDEIKALVDDPSTDILSENINGQDVTKEYTDLTSQLTNLENTEKKLQEIMDEATKTEDVLAVYNQLVSVRGQIEVIKGQIKYYDESVALSLISVSIQSKEAVEPLSIGGWKPVGVARDALQATLNGFKFLANLAIWLILFALPIGLVIYFPLRLLWRLIRRGRKKTPPTPPASPDNAPPVAE